MTHWLGTHSRVYVHTVHVHCDAAGYTAPGAIQPCLLLLASHTVTLPGCKGATAARYLGLGVYAAFDILYPSLVRKLWYTTFLCDYAHSRSNTTALHLHATRPAHGVCQWDTFGCTYSCLQCREKRACGVTSDSTQAPGQVTEVTKVQGSATSANNTSHSHFQRKHTHVAATA
jgi:hypothetical protein